jgi:hypothetical protein
VIDGATLSILAQVLSLLLPIGLVALLVRTVRRRREAAIREAGAWRGTRTSSRPHHPARNDDDRAGSPVVRVC